MFAKDMRGFLKKRFPPPVLDMRTLLAEPHTAHNQPTMANNPLETGARNHHSRGRAKPSVTIATPRSRPPSLKYLLALALAGLSWLAALSTCNYRGLLAPSSVVSDDKIDLAWQPVVVTEKKHGGNSSDPFALARSQSFGETEAPLSRIIRE